VLAELVLSQPQLVAGAGGGGWMGAGGGGRACRACG
jgi:hypothetical protein